MVSEPRDAIPMHRRLRSTVKEDDTFRCVRAMGARSWIYRDAQMANLQRAAARDVFRGTSRRDLHDRRGRGQAAQRVGAFAAQNW